jgi:agmatinase
MGSVSPFEAFERLPDGPGIEGRFCGLTDEFSNYADSRFVIIPIPFEGTVSQGGGTALGPASIIEASRYIEFLDSYTDSAPFVSGIHTTEDVIGDSPEAVFERLEKAVSKILADGKIPVPIGGEHSITLGPARAINALGSPFGVLQFDAHTDLRSSYEGEEFSHACVMHHCLKLDNMSKLVQVGIRAWSWYERETAKDPRILSLPWNALVGDWMERAVSALPEHVYITLDVDALDPSIMPSTGTPEPCGMSWQQVMGLIELVMAKRTVIGFDIVEFAPIEQLHHPESALAVMIYRMMALHARSRGSA